MPNDPKTDALGLPADPEELRAAAAVMQERLRVIAEAEAALAVAAAPEAAPDPEVEVEWIKTPQPGSCYHANRYYYGQGPAIHRPTGRIVKPGQRSTVPADAARVFAEAGYVRVLSGDEHIRWSPMEGAAAVNTAHPDPADAKAWEALSHS